jgi:hypothetical protein
VNAPQWTAGPWQLGWHNTVCSTVSKWEEIPLATGWIEGAWHDTDATTESLANARLISKAPEMFQLIADIEDSYKVLREACRKLMAEALAPIEAEEDAQ